MKTLARVRLLAWLSILAIALIPVAAGANTWTVTNTQDHSIGFCTSSDCTLREAITIAGDGDVITFASTVTGTITLGGAGELFIQHNITINGPGANVLAISGADATRVFEINQGSTVSISGLTIRDGFVNVVDPSLNEGMGGGILNRGKLRLTACNVTGNLVSVGSRGMGGGLHNQNGSTAVIRNCTIDSNLVQAGEAWGGGMSSRSSNVTVINSTFSNNVIGPLAPINIGYGGGILSVASTITLVNCTVAFNDFVGGTTTNTGGGIARLTGGANFVENTLIYGNHANVSPDAFGSFSSLGHNLVGVSTGSTWDTTKGDKLDAAAAPVTLTGLAYNGGPTKTHALSGTGPAVDGGDDTAKDPGPDDTFGTSDDVPLTTDQRGSGFPRLIGAHIDIGSTEADQAQPGPTFIVTTTDEHSDGFCGQVDCSLWDAANAADNNVANNSVITFAPQVVGTITVTIQPSGMNLLRPMTIVGPGARVLTISGNNKGRIFNVTGNGVVISGLTITHGEVNGAKESSPSSPAQPGSGGGILNSGTLTLNDSTLTANVVFGGDGTAGGGAPGAGGAIDNTGSLILNRCTVSNNGTYGGSPGARATGGAAFGGAIENGNAGTLFLTNCTLSENFTNGGPGGNDPGGTNPGAGGNGFGGALNSQGKTTITNCTFTDNLSSGGTGGNGVNFSRAPDGLGKGGGIAVSVAGTALRNTIVAGNRAISSGDDLFGNLDSDDHDFIGGDAHLARLGNNGGPTDTCALLKGSPAIDAGNDAIAPATDQRGSGRVGKSDIGAFEFQPPPGLVVNVSTRLPVGTDDSVLIEGFIVDGPPGSTKKIIVRAIGPSLIPFGISDGLVNPTLDIFDANNIKIASNNDWKTTQVGGIIAGDQFSEIAASGVAPSNDLESAIIANLGPGSYTAVVRGLGNTIGTGVVDAYDLSPASAAKLVNIATRGLIQPGDKLMIAGFITQNGPVRAVVRAIGPSLTAFGIANALPDTTLQLRDQNGAIVVENDDWKMRSDGSSQQAELEATGLQPSNDLEAAFVTILQPGPYTAQVRGKPETTGIGVVQAYFLP